MPNFLTEDNHGDIWNSLKKKPAKASSINKQTKIRDPDFPSFWWDNNY